MKFKFITFIFLVSILSASDVNYDKIFEYLHKNKIILGEDIDEKELFNLIKNEENFGNEYYDYSKLNVKINKLLLVKEKHLSKITTQLNKNKNSKVNKEVRYFIDDNDKRVNESQKIFQSSSEDSFFTKIINDILEMLKFNKEKNE